MRMDLLPAFFAVVVLLAFLNAILQVAVAVHWNRVENPGRPLLKPVTLCATTAAIRIHILYFWRHAVHHVARISRQTKNRLLQDQRGQEHV